jgi:hypothetical protein
MAKIVQFPGSITTYQGTVSPGAKPFRSSELAGLVKSQRRPNNLFRYVYAVLTQVKFTPTYSGQTATALAASAVWQLLANYTLMLKRMTRPVIEHLGSLDTLKLTQQLLQYIDADRLSSLIPVAAIASSQSTHEQTVQFVLPLAPRFHQKDDPQKFMGLVPLSAFEGATLDTTVFASDTLQADWEIGDLTIEQRLLCVDLDAAIAYQPVFMTGTTMTNQQIDVPLGNFPVRLLGIMGTHPTGATSLVLPTAFSANFDGVDRIAHRVVADDLIENLLFRDGDAFDDAIWPTSLRILSPDGQGLDQMPIINKSLIVTDAFAGTGMNNSGRLLYAWAEDLPEGDQLAMMTDFEVPASIAAAKIGARSSKDIGLVTDIVQWAA